MLPGVRNFWQSQAAAAAIGQIKGKDYAGKYAGSEKQLLGLGINFSSEKKNVERWEVIKLN